MIKKFFFLNCCKFTVVNYKPNKLSFKNFFYLSNEKAGLEDEIQKKCWNDSSFLFIKRKIFVHNNLSDTAGI